MPALRFEQLPETMPEYVDVDVSEWFGRDDVTDESYTVRVTGLTVHKKNLLSQFTNDLKRNDDGQWVATLSTAHDSASVIAALSTYDDDGNLTFGIDYKDAIDRVENLPAHYRPMILKISSVAISLSAISDESVTDAQKN